MQRYFLLGIIGGFVALLMSSVASAQVVEVPGDLVRAEADLTALQRQLATVGQDAQESERLRKQVELQQKQLDVLNRMVRLLAERVRPEQPDAADLEARAKQGAQRAKEVAQEIGDIREQIDAERRNGPTLPATLRELFQPTRPNQSPLAIYGTLSSDFQAFQDGVSNFPSPVFSPHFYLLLNEKFLLEVNPEFRLDQVEIESAQLDWFVSDHLTLLFGRFYSSLGFFNERLHTSWIFKTPDRPLMFSQVLPGPLSFSGVQARGAAFLGDCPVKLEYSAFVVGGFSLTETNPTARHYADLRSMSDEFNDVNNDKAVGGRLGLTVPPLGVTVGLSGLANGDYDRFGHSLSLWDVDFSYHKGNWDFRFEYAMVNQQAPGRPIRRQGLYAQAAYRPHDCLDPILQRLEGVLRFDYVRFDGIDLTKTGLAFGGRDRIPVDRARTTVGLNYYAYESLIFKVAYEVNDELRFRERRDNGFLAQVAWGF